MHLRDQILVSLEVQVFLLLPNTQIALNEINDVGLVASIVSLEVVLSVSVVTAGGCRVEHEHSWAASL